MTSLLAIALAVAALAVPAPQQAPDAPTLAGQLQARYERVRDFSADFEHVYQGGVLKKKVTARGTLLVKKPGMMRWTYTAPEKKEFVSDGVRLYSYVPEDRQVIVSPVPAAGQAGNSALLLAGQGNLARDFTPSIAQLPGLPAGDVALKLVPVNRQPDYDSILLVVDRGTLQLRQLITTDAQGGTSAFTFTRLRENVGLPDKAFTFTIPRGVDVIHEGSRSR